MCQPWPVSANLDLVRSIFTQWERGDYRSTEWADPVIEYQIADGPDPGRWSGLAGLAEGVRGWLSTGDGVRLIAEGYRELEDGRILVLIHRAMRGKVSGLELGPSQTKGAVILDVSGGKVTRLVAYWGREQALADLGLEA
jgi:ketosteroid isomerase-like protein